MGYWDWGDADMHKNRKKTTKGAGSGLTVAVLTKNAQETLKACLDSVAFAEHLLVIDHQSTDKTLDIAMQYTDTILSTSEPSFAKRREMAMKECVTDWIMYVDSDEVVPDELAFEVQAVVQGQDEGVYQITRENYFLGKKMYPDFVERLFHVHVLRGFSGEVHESPITTRQPKQLINPLIHYTHRDISSMLTKTNDWSEIEARLRLEAQHPPMAWWRLFRVAVTVLYKQFWQLKLLRYGREGLFEGYFQMIDKLIVYTKLWEKQRA